MVGGNDDFLKELRRVIPARGMGNAVGRRLPLEDLGVPRDAGGPSNPWNTRDIVGRPRCFAYHAHPLAVARMRHQHTVRRDNIVASSHGDADVATKRKLK